MTEKKQGRPPVKPELKARSRTFILNDVQYQQLLKNASAAGLNRNAYLISKLNLNPSEETR
jgi:hypothetical protein